MLLMLIRIMLMLTVTLALLLLLMMMLINAAVAEYADTVAADADDMGAEC